jgi:hypothetical protein
MPVITQTIAVGKWADRKKLDYQPVNSRVINGSSFNAFGVANRASLDLCLTRRPYKIDESESVTYVMYDDDSESEVAIYRSIVE